MLAAAAFSGTAAATEAASDAAKVSDSSAAEQAPKCPEPNRDGALAGSRPRKSEPVAPLPEEVQFEADGIEGTRDGQLKLTGEVVISQGERQIKTRDATYNQEDQSFQVDNGVEYSDSAINVRGSGAQVDRAGGAVFEGAEFELADRNARGSADRIRATTEGNLSLDRVRYTTCPLGNEDWKLTASDIDINQRAAIGVG
ncbi:MAG: LptA/OstA family protein, partial [Steroidobacter sp.]